MKCPYCKEEIERNSTECSVCGEKISKLYSYMDYLKEIFSTDKAKKIIKKSAITVSILVAIIVIVFLVLSIIRHTMDEIESNKFTDKGYRSIINNENYTRAAWAHADIGEQYDKILPLFTDISTQEQDLLKFFKKSKSKENNVKLFTIFINNVDKYREDTEFIYNNANKTFDSLGIKTAEPVTISNKNKPIAVITPVIKSFYLLLDNSNGNNYVWFKYNYKYMLDTYAPYLTDDWKDYFAYQYESNKEFKGLDWDNPKSRPILRKWAKKWGDFIKKYPNFIYADEFAEYVYELNSY